MSHTMKFSHPLIDQGMLEFQNKKVRITGKIMDSVQNGRISYTASAPPDFHASFTGSGLPFANPSMAFGGSPNNGEMEVGSQNKFDITITMPNSFYSGLGTVLVTPSLFIRYNDNSVITIELGNGIPYRMLTYPSTTTAPRKSAMFYDGTWELPVRTQEQILRDSAYPSTDKMHSNFWGLKPRC